MTKKTIVFATNNSNKIKEVKEILGDDFTILSLNDIGCHEELPETKETLEGNAIQKAMYVYEHYQHDCFADDTGLLIAAINNEPGVYSARYAGAQRNAIDNMDLVLTKLSNKKNRDAKFQTVIALVEGGVIKTFEGEVKGHIATSKSGTAGFGYDPIFVPEDSNQTFSEMTAQEKNAISHRGRAVKKLVTYLIK